MSLVQKVNPVGVDFLINQLQASIYSYLISVGWTNYESYARAYVNPKQGGTVPELYNGNNEYKECLLDDKYNATSFFTVGNTKSYSERVLTQDVSIIFQSDIVKLYPSILHRADEEMHEDIYNAIPKGYRKYLKEIVTGVNNVYSELNIPAEFIDRVRLDDMSNYHVVKINLEMPFTYCN